MSENNIESIPRTALYIRVSTEEQALHGLSLDAQQAALEKWAKDNQCKIVGIYIDGGKTARKSLKSRTELTRLLADVEQDKIDLIIFTKLDRWFRNIKDYYKVQDILEKHNVNWKTIFENYDTTTANGRLYINIMLSLAQDEADRTSERIKAVFANKRANGEATSPKVPIGYRFEKSKILIDEERAPIARTLFEHYYLHHSMYAAQQNIIDVFGIYLQNGTVKRMLTNTLYKGEYYGHKDFCEPLIDEKQFDEIQEIIKSRNVKVTPSQYDYIFSGMLVCAECGHRLIGNAQKRTSADGRQVYYSLYRCNKYYGSRNCTHRGTISEKRIETYLIKHITAEINDYIYKFETQQKKKRKPKIDKNEIRRKLDRLKELYLNDLIDIEAYKKDYEELTAKLNAIEPQDNVTDLSVLKEFLNSDFLDIYDTLDNESKRIVWRGIISRIVVSAENDIKIEFTN